MAFSISGISAASLAVLLLITTPENLMSFKFSTMTHLEEGKRGGGWWPRSTFNEQTKIHIRIFDLFLTKSFCIEHKGI